MEKQRLGTLRDRGLSLAEIGRIEGLHPSTVGYWMRKHGISANGAAKYSPKGAVERGRLAAFVSEGLTLREIGENLGISIATVRYWIRRYELDAPRIARRGEIERAFSEGRRTLERKCKRHGWTSFVLENSGRVRCRRCRIEGVTEWRRRTKRKLVAESGGRCVICGYDRCQAAMQFHHVDPREKEFHLSDKGVTRSIEALRAEAAKCALLCGNCHAEVEAGVTSLG